MTICIADLEVKCPGRFGKVAFNRIISIPRIKPSSSSSLSSDRHAFIDKAMMSRNCYGLL